MREEDDNERGGNSHTVKVGAIVAPLVAAIYVLSVGPAAMLRDSGRISQDTFLLFYAPVALLTYFPPTNAALESYLSLWTKP
jgi:hypothetical protein